jgi:LacI family transcriptional regulator
MKKKPDAIFTITDRMAIGAMLAIKEKGLSMPDDIGLIGFNNEPITKLVTPSISSIEQPAFELGKVAAKLLIEVMNNEADLNDREIVLEPKIFVRESTNRRRI